MRALTTALLAAGVLAAPIGSDATTKRSHHTVPTATPACEFPADRAAFDIEGLKSQLMVTALACKQQDRYNAFMSRFQPTVAAEEHELTAYFKRSYGRQAQKAYDDYISNLANIQSEDSLKSGTAFCDNIAVMFDEVQALHDSTELHDFANAKTIAQPVTFEMCTAAAPTGVSHSRRSSRHT
jgi:hypothetical protein